MRSKALVLMSALLICSSISSTPLLAQSKDRNNPTPLLSPEIKGFSVAVSVVYWYKLTAGPGELVIEMEVENDRRYYGGISARFVLYDKDMQEVLNESLSIIGPYAMSKNKSLKLKGKQEFLLSIILEGGTPGATYMIRFKGPIDLPSKESEEKDD